jgi:hypothetical protein
MLAAMLTVVVLMFLPAIQTLSAGADFEVLDDTGILSNLEAEPASNNERLAPTVTLRAASGATIPFKTANGQTVDDLPLQELEMPLLVLLRNGELTEPRERTLIIEIDGLAGAPAGITVTLRVETQHGDPDKAGDPAARIAVWSETIRPDAADLTGLLVLEHQFDRQLLSDGDMVTTPTDYFRYDLVISNYAHPQDDPLARLSVDHALLMENQWVTQLPPVAELAPGAAPEELALYSCDMFPLRKTIGSPDTWVPREELPSYLDSELIPAMVAAFELQTEVWGFPWHPAWTSYRTGKDAERLSVALSDGETWYHGQAPDRGHSGISIASRDTAHYDSLTDALMSVFNHELFHNLQRNINLSFGGDGNVDGAEDAWEFFTEGTAVLASSVAQRDVQFSTTSIPRIYLSYARSFPQNGSYRDMDPYRAALYWRFLYESCGGMSQGVEDPAAGMQVIREALVALYSGAAVDIRTSTELVERLPAVMDLALSRSPGCPFRSYEESLSSFAHAIYKLRLTGGRCTAPGLPAGCGLYDPNTIYREPLFSRIYYQGEELVYTHRDQSYPAGVSGSYGFDFIQVDLEPEGDALIVEVSADRIDATEFNVQMVRLVESEDGLVAVSAPEELHRDAATSRLTALISDASSGEFSSLGLIITRIDSQEHADPVGAYTLVLRPLAANAQS